MEQLYLFDENGVCICAEEWRDIVGYEGQYQVSSLGNVRNLNYHRQGYVKNLKPRVGKYGYLYVNLSKKNKVKTFKVHRLVAIAFIPNPLNLPQINHKNEDKLDNRVENLEWCTAEYNTKYGTRTKRANDSHCKAVAQYDKNGNLIKIWRSARDAGCGSISKAACITTCLKGRIPTAYGSCWKYA